MTFFDTEDARRHELERARRDAEAPMTISYLYGGWKHPMMGPDERNPAEEVGSPDYQSPAMRLQIIRNKLAVINAASARYAKANAAGKLVLEGKMANQISGLFDHLSWLEDEGHLKEFQELLMAESAGTP